MVSNGKYYEDDTLVFFFDFEQDSPWEDKSEYSDDYEISYSGSPTYTLLNEMYGFS